MKSKKWKQVCVLTLAFILIASISTISVRAEGVNVVILVSNNEADSAVAMSIASLLNISVIVTPWGIYKPNVTAEIIKQMPDKVIIIGGPVAVPVEYEQDLDNLGIPYERWYGEDRYSTNIRVIENAKEEFPGIFDNVKVLIVNGRDQGAIEVIKKLKLKRIVPIFVDNGLENQTEVIGSLIRPKNVVIVKSPLLTQKMSVILQQMVERNGVTLSQITVEASKELCLEAITNTESVLELAKDILDDLKIPGAKNMLELANKELEKSKEEYSRGNYISSYRYAIYARNHADVVVFLAGKEKNKILHGLPTVALEHDILRLQIQIQALANSGADVSEVQKLIQQAEDYLQKGDLESAFDIVQVIKEKLRNLFVNEKSRNKHKPEHSRGKRH
ncbi:cell wall-binding repeat-containing protein [Thermococcus sp.]